jgi:hypothetical protein
MNLQNKDTELVTYTYLYDCSRWWGSVKGVRNISHRSVNENVILKYAKKEAENITGSKTCDIKLLQKFHMLIKSSKPYPSLLQFPLSTIKDK